MKKRGLFYMPLISKNDFSMRKHHHPHFYHLSYQAYFTFEAFEDSLKALLFVLLLPIGRKYREKKASHQLILSWTVS